MAGLRIHRYIDSCWLYQIPLNFAQSEVLDSQTNRMLDIDTWAQERGISVILCDVADSETRKNRAYLRCADPSDLKRLKEKLRSETTLCFENPDAMFEFKMRWL